MVSSAKAISKTLCNLPALRGDLLRAGVRSQCAAGMEMGDALVGLQRILFESERPHLPAGRGMLWFGWYAAQLLSAAILYEIIPQDQAQMAAGTVRRPVDGFYS